MVHVVQSLGVHYRNLGLYTQASEELLKAVDLATTLKNDRLLCNVFHEAGGVKLDEASYALALELLKISRARCETVGFPLQRLSATEGIVYLRQRKFKKAYRVLKEWKGRPAFANYYLVRKRYMKALELFLSFCKGLDGSADDKVVCDLGLAFSYEGIDDRKMALRHFKQARASIESQIKILPQKYRPIFVKDLYSRSTD